MNEKTETKKAIKELTLLLMYLNCFTDEKDFMLEINKEIEKAIKPVAPVPVAENFIQTIKEIQNTNIANASTTNNSAIEDIINPNLKKKAKQKLKHIQSTEEIKGTVKEKLEEYDENGKLINEECGE